MKMYPTLISESDHDETIKDLLSEGVDFWVLFLENTNNIIRPGGDGPNDNDEGKSRTETKSIKNRWDT